MSKYIYNQDKTKAVRADLIAQVRYYLTSRGNWMVWGCFTSTDVNEKSGFVFGTANSEVEAQELMKDVLKQLEK